jgi:peroxiredoxin
MALSTGTKAPDFNLPTMGADGPELFKLSEKVGDQNIVLLFVPMAFTGGCTKELCSVTNELDEYGQLNALVVGISGDNPFAQAEWAAKENIKLPLLSDYEHTATKDYGVAYETFLPDKNLIMGGVSKRSAFVIDKQGIIQYAESQDNPGEMPDFDKIKETLKSLG